MCVKKVILRKILVINTNHNTKKTGINLETKLIFVEIFINMKLYFPRKCRKSGAEIFTEETFAESEQRDKTI